MLSNLFRDEPLVPAVADRMAAMREYFEEAARVLAAPWPRRKLVGAALRHVTDFHTWRSLARDGGLTRAQAVALATAMVEAAVSRTPAAEAAGAAAGSRPRAGSRRG